MRFLLLRPFRAGSVPTYLTDSENGNVVSSLHKAGFAAGDGDASVNPWVQELDEAAAFLAH